MGTIWIKEFTGGLDTRRMAETTAGGVLVVANDGHISRGGEFEKRPAFVPIFTLPAATVGLARTKTSLVVFGSIAAPALPGGVTYQRLQHSDGVTAVDTILSWSLNTGKLYVAALFTDGSIFHFYNGVRITDLVDGRARSQFRVTGGTGANTTTSITVNGVEILGATVTWATNNAATAAAIAAQINTFTSTPDYTATSSGDLVNILATTAGAATNGFPVVFTGTIPLTPSTGLLMANGSDTTQQPGPFVQTYGSRELTVSGPVLYGSGIQQPTKFNTNTTGAFFIDMSAQTTDADTLTGTAEYQSFVAVFATRTIMTWVIDSDPSNNRKSQVLRNTGTFSGKSITQFGDSDLFYIDESGIRSLKARDSSNAAATSDIGVSIDTLITAKLQMLNDAERSNCIGLIEPVDGRFWLIMKDIIYVFSFFPGSKVSAWSTYEPGFNISDAVVFNRKVYVRSGDVIFAFGGIGVSPTYDGTIAELFGPYLDGDAPTVKKTITGIDAACVGHWTVSIGMDPVNAAAEDKICDVVETSYSQHSIPSEGEFTHLQPRIRSVGNGFAKFAAAVLHYQGEPPDED